MNCGLTNLNTLKKHLLAGSLDGETKFDPVIAMIGLGVAGLFDTFCNRKLAWMESEVVTYSGDRPHMYLPRYPIRQVRSVNMRYFQTDTWCEITGQPITVNFESGMIHFGYTLGRFPLQVQTVWDGGYWFETLEPEVEGYPSTAPAANAADPNSLPARFFLLPDVLRSAFLFQCEAIWSARDKLGIGLIDKPGSQSEMGRLEISPLVKMMLQPFVRYQLS